ncbi:MAG: F-type H+-transporting ATPase subunit gamma [Gaiellales bacterium]|jgi:F-type H+-transporting ATPase subunit gamma|nr:F-type H+-transporting ATPase subunit gamma [Gaiellales bacterium]MDX6545841.1 F-type H+-transporting ATPase subunit gamma [Gaiellales bacterium]
MATQQDIKRRIASVNNTKKITKAMELVAGSRLRRAQARIEALRPYADRMQQLVVDVAAATGEAHDQPLLARRDVKTVAVVALTGDRGLAGAFNATVVRRSLEIAREQRAAGNEVVWLVVGRRGASTLRFRRQSISADYTGITDRPSYADGQAIAKRVADLYSDGEVDRVVMVYNHFLSALSQRLDEVELLPVPEAAVTGESTIEGSYIYEPDAREILSQLIPTYLEITIYRALLESTASEHGARMTAMRNASDNAGTLIDDLTLKMNRARQAEITQEILEVVAGADALT